MNLARRRQPARWRLARLGLAVLMLLVSALVTLDGAQPADADNGPGQGQGRHHKEVRLAPVAAPKNGPAKPLREPTNKVTARSAPTWNKAAHATDPIDLKLLVVSADGQETTLPAIKAFLDQIGIPYTVFIGFNPQTRTKTPMTSSVLQENALHGYYQGIILVTSNLVYYDAQTGQYPSAFDVSDWNALWAYESAFAIRQVTAETAAGWPETDNYGLSYPSTPRDTTGNPLTTRLTPAGQQVFNYLQATAPITITNAYTYLSTPVSSGTTTVTPLLLSDPDPANGNKQYAIVSVASRSDSGRENMAITTAHNPYLLHSILLSYGVINWVTKGFFIGERHVNLNYQPDDILIDDDLWDTTRLTDTTGLTYRMSGADLTAAANFQARIRGSANTSTFTIEWPFNCEGATGIYSPDTLTAAVKQYKSTFNWISHTYTHLNLDAPTTAAQVQTELTNNRNCANRTLGLPAANFAHDAMVQPDISGLNNTQAISGAYNWGIRYWISDTSQPGWDNPSPNAGFYRGVTLSNAQRPISPPPSLLVIPRKPTNLFYNLSTPAEWVSEYNCYYGPTGTCAGGTWRIWDHNLTYAEILDQESDWLLRYLLTWSLDPVMFHQPNVRAYDGTHSLFSDLVDATLAKYNLHYNLPIRNLTQHNVGLKMAARMAFNQANVRASWDRNRTITITASQTVDVPVTGIASGSKQERYGNQPISTFTVNANKTVTVTLPTVPPSP